MHLAHLSDLHFGSFTFSPLQFFSKRWIGNFNYLLTRKRAFDYNRLLELIELLKSKQVTHVAITGDFTVTSRTIEYQMGQKFVHLLQKEGMQVFAIPGNHDTYTRQSCSKKRFYRFFSPTFDTRSPLNLRDHRVTFSNISPRLWLLGIDTAVAVGLLSAQGIFSPHIEHNLKKALDHIPSDDAIILLNHYPFFHNKIGRHDLIRAHVLESLLKKAPNIALYLHGHTHRRVVADLRASSLPILSDPGSTPHRDGGGCHLFEIDDNAIKLAAYLYDKGWQKCQTNEFSR